MPPASTRTMADLFVAATVEWERRALRKVMPPFHEWCAASNLIGTGPGQFQHAFLNTRGTNDPNFARGASVTFVDGSMAVRDLDELNRRGVADWRALQRLSEDLIRHIGADSL